MKVEWYREVCRVIDRACPVRRRPRQQFGDHVILKVHFWSVGWHKPTHWACDPGNWTDAVRDELLPGDLPSQPTMSRRLAGVPLRQALERVSLIVAERFPDGPVKAIDSRPLRVGSYSKDREAKRGRAAGEMARGYKLHAVVRDAATPGGGALWPWRLTAMNTADRVPAVPLLAAINDVEAAGGTCRWGYVAADNLFDSNPVHVAAGAAGHQMVAPPRRSNEGVRDRRRNSGERLRGLDLADELLPGLGVANGFGRRLMADRVTVEQRFGHQCTMGFDAPPAWVRRPHRVALWIGAALVLQGLRKLKIKGLAA